MFLFLLLLSIKLDECKTEYICFTSHASTDELQKRNDVIRALSKRTKVVEAREKDVYRELNSTQLQLHEMNQTQLNASRHQQDLEAKIILLLSVYLKAS